MELQGEVSHVESRSIRLEMVLVLVQDRCTVCAKRSIGSKNRSGGVTEPTKS